MRTMADVARHAGVPVATVSHVLNATRPVRPATATPPPGAPAAPPGAGSLRPHAFDRADLFPPSLTAVRRPSRDLGRPAPRLLLERPDLPGRPAPCTLVHRTSCGCPPDAVGLPGWRRLRPAHRKEPAP